MILDVGCGERPKGNVNVDLFVEETSQRFCKRGLNTRVIPNFIKASISHLPFSDNTFETVLCFHVVEHTDNPIESLRELIRVSKRNIVVKTPHRFSKTACLNPWHKHTFNKTWFLKALTKIKQKTPLTFIIEYSAYAKFPHMFLPLIQIPQEVTATIYKLNDDIILHRYLREYCHV